MKPCQTSKKESTQEREREKKNKEQGPKSRQADSPKEACHREVIREPQSIETSISCMKHIN
jgi:hypothetical protein